MDAAYDLFAYVQGPYARVDEERAHDDLEVIGELPAELDGMFVQNSPNPRHAPLGFHHWFDGDGMVHGVMLRDGKASYRNRWVATKAAAEEDAAGHGLYRGILDRFDPEDMAHADKNTANTDLIWHNGQLLALWWLAGDTYALSVPDLKTKGVETFGNTLSCGLSAHPKVDPRTGELIFFDYSAYSPSLRHGVVSAEGQVVHTAEIPVDTADLLHDVAITENHTIIPCFPMRFDAAKLPQGKRRVNWHPEDPTRFAVVPRFGGPEDVKWFEASACYCYHTVNAWEHVGADGHRKITLLACRIEDPVPSKPRDTELHIPRLFHLRLEPYLHAWTFDLDDGSVTEEQLDDVPTEFPRMNDRFLGQQARFAYHPRIKAEPTLMFDACIQYDLAAGTSKTHVWGKHHAGSEMVFAPRAGATEENDGWVVAFVHDLESLTSELHVLDGKDVEAGPVARVKMPVRVPIGFHAEWVPGEGIA